MFYKILLKDGNSLTLHTLKDIGRERGALQRGGISPFVIRVSCNSQVFIYVSVIILEGESFVF